MLNEEETSQMIYKATKDVVMQIKSSDDLEVFFDESLVRCAVMLLILDGHCDDEDGVVGTFIDLCDSIKENVEAAMNTH